MPRFDLERHPGWLTARYELSSSDCAPLSLDDTLSLADDECAAWWRDLSLGYPADVRGDPVLRAEIAKHHGGGDADNVLVVAPQEGIFLAMNAILSPGDRVIVTSPCYQSLSAVAEHAVGCEIVPWAPVWPDGGGAAPRGAKNASF